jgi:uncharacterized protein YrzB (UPF0473 family)
MDNTNYDDMNFTILDNNGKEVFCDIISLIPNEDNTKTYVVFTDYSKDEDDNIVFMYGNLVIDGEDINLERNVSEDEVTYIKSKLGDDFCNHVIDYLKKENIYE